MAKILPLIKQVFIKLEVADENVLSLMLSASGALNRMGDGSGDPEVNRFFMGSSPEPLFQQLIAGIDEKIFELAGRYELPFEGGEMLRLTLHFKGEKLDTGFEFSYGSDSMGPPEELLEIVEQAVALTDGWYEAQLMKNRSN